MNRRMLSGKNGTRIAVREREGFRPWLIRAE